MEGKGRKVVFIFLLSGAGEGVNGFSFDCIRV